MHSSFSWPQRLWRHAKPVGGDPSLRAETPVKEFSIRFRIEEGRSTYIGEFLAHRVVSDGSNASRRGDALSRQFIASWGGLEAGTPVSEDIFFVTRDMLARDLSVISARGEYRQYLQVIEVVPEVRISNVKFFQSSASE